MYELQQSLKKMSNVVVNSKQYLCLKGREKNINLRIEREKESAKKLLTAYSVARVFKYVPSVKMIGISGGLAMLNADENDDIDFFIITTPQTMWITRLILLCVLQVMGLRRKKRVSNSKNKVCLNMFVSLDNVQTKRSRQDIYTAHEIMQLKVLVNKDKTYEYYLSKNEWIKKYLPHSFPVLSNKNNHVIKTGKLESILQFFDKYTRYFQFLYMKKSITTEEISETLLAFHPKDYRGIILNKFAKRKEKYAHI